MLTKGAHKKRENGSEPMFGHPAPREVEFDPVVKFGTLVNLEEVSRRQNPSLRVLRCTRSGLTVYVHPPVQEKPDPTRCRYVVAYEGEISISLHVKQILIQSNDASSVWAVLSLVERHSQALYEKLCATPRPADPLHPKNLEQLAGFHLTRTRRTVNNALASLSGVELKKDAYQGFVNAVISLTSENACQFQPQRNSGLRMLLEQFQGRNGVPSRI